MEPDSIRRPKRGSEARMTQSRRENGSIERIGRHGSLIKSLEPQACPRRSRNEDGKRETKLSLHDTHNASLFIRSPSHLKSMELTQPQQQGVAGTSSPIPWILALWGCRLILAFTIGVLWGLCLQRLCQRVVGGCKLIRGKIPRGWFNWTVRTEAWEPSQVYRDNPWSDDPWSPVRFRAVHGLEGTVSARENGTATRSTEITTADGSQEYEGWSLSSPSGRRERQLRSRCPRSVMATMVEAVSPNPHRTPRSGRRTD